MAQRGWVSTTLIILLAIAVGAGVYFYQSLYSDLTQLNKAHEEALSESKRLQQELFQARQRLTQRSTSADRLEARLNEAQQSLVNAANKLEASQGQIGNLRDRIQDLEASLSASQTLASGRGDQLTQAQARIDELKEQLAQGKAQITELHTSNEKLEVSLARAREKQTLTRDRVDELSEELEVTRAALGQAQDLLAQKENTLEEVTEERLSVAEKYREARKQLALQQARSRSASETIRELEARLQRERFAMNNLQIRLQALSNEKQALVSRLEDGTTVIKLPENIVFDSGSARIGKPGRETLQLLATALESFPDHLISVQGHSDSRPISPSLQDQYPTNWELSAARAASAVRVLRDNSIAPERMQAVGYADTRPLVEETDSASRRMNRRIEVLLYPDQFNVKAHSGLTAN